MEFKKATKEAGNCIVSVLATASLIAMGFAFGKRFYKAWDTVLTELEKKYESLGVKIREKLTEKKEEK